MSPNTSNESKTLAIDTSEILEHQRAPSGGGDDFPKTVAIDSEELARKIEAARQESAAAPVESGGKRWGLVAAAVAAILVLAYLFAG